MKSVIDRIIPIVEVYPSVAINTCGVVRKAMVGIPQNQRWAVWLTIGMFDHAKR